MTAHKPAEVVAMDVAKLESLLQRIETETLEPDELRDDSCRARIVFLRHPTDRP